MGLFLKSERSAAGVNAVLGCRRFFGESSHRRTMTSIHEYERMVQSSTLAIIFVLNAEPAKRDTA
jgi:hypothetical protein